MRKLLLTFAIAITAMNVFAQNFNISFLSQRPYPGEQLANICGWVSSTGVEYALVGTESGMSIVDVSTPTNPVEVQLVTGPQSNWREIKTYLNYAYVTTEGGNGLQIVDLSQLPAAAPAVLYTGDGAIAGQIDNIHSLHIEDGHVYLHGSNLFNGAALICDIATNPLAPIYKGHTPGTYIHDGYVRGNLYYSCHIYDGYVSIFDVTNKANPVLLNQQITPGAFTHNSWLSTDSNFVFTTDEVNDSYLTSYDISNATNITELDRIQITPGSGSIVHNTHIIEKNGGDYAVTSWYKDGVVITDVTRPQNMVNVGWYDTYTQGTGGGFSGCWGVYPYLPSGNIVASDINNGLFVIGPTYIRACYLEGTVTDSVSGLPLFNALVQIVSTTLTENSKINGEYKTGTVNPGTYDVTFSKAGYQTKTYTGVVLTNGVLTIQDAQLVTNAPAITLTGQVIETGTGTPIANAQVSLTNVNFDYTTTADASGNFTIPTFFTGTYDVVAGQWGHRTKCLSINITTSPVVIDLDKGWYDDFSFDFGWTNTNATHDWERGEPVGTTSMGNQSNPNFDVTTDCLDQAYVTGNGGGAASDDDVDPNDGTVVLTSPVFDLTGYVNPQLQYYRWFFNGELNGNSPNDEMILRLTNGITTVTLETILNNTAGNSTWLFKTWNIASLLTPTANMQMTVETSDDQPSSIVEGGLDKFEITDVVGVNEISVNGINATVFPNPFTGAFTFTYNMDKTIVSPIMVITDVLGKEVEKIELTQTIATIEAGKNLTNGIYFVTVKSGNQRLQTIKVVKAD